MIGKTYQPIHLSAIPIGAYGSKSEQWFHTISHMNPSEAVKCHQDIGSKKSLGIHWGTFQLTAEPFFEPPLKLAKAKKESNLHDEAFVVLKQGETMSFIP